MQTIHKVCLTLTGVCVVILCVGIGIGIGHRVKSDSNDTSVEYEAYDDDYVDDDIRKGGVIDVRGLEQKCEGTIKIFLKEETDRHLLKLISKKMNMIKKIRKSPQYYQVAGTCCWKVFSMAHHRGKHEILTSSGSDRKRNTFAIRSVELADC